MRSFQELDGDVERLAWLWVRERARLAVRLGERACRRLSPSHVHEVRVACRRLRAALAFFDLTSRGPRWEELDAAARRVAKVVAPLRELDVACRRLAALDVSPEGRGGAVAIETARSSLLARWRRERHKEAERRGDRLAKRVDRLAAAKKKLVRPGDEEARGQGWLDERLARLEADVRGAASRAAAARASGLRETGRRTKVNAPASDEAAWFRALHEARIAIKHQRYAWELSRSFASPEERRAHAARLEALQKRGGDLQDGVDLAARLARALERGHVKGAGAIRLLASAVAVRDAAAASFVAALAQAWPSGADDKSPSSAGEDTSGSPSSSAVASPRARRPARPVESSVPARARATGLSLVSSSRARPVAVVKPTSPARAKGTTS
jgi:CHAD domain-containing protein